jgi:hypothetical protein
MPRPIAIATDRDGRLLKVCVPKKWSDKKIVDWCNKEKPSGTSHGWSVCKEGHPTLNDYPERVQCEEYENFVHLVLEAL